ncbi:hypothetical protein G4B88_000056 [Cannabis sativa]|uniref:Histone deacetylase interacting domain-containing protein n=1 Tax=Cannabis sativa TaxID=3483 RepID=A0A7J6G0A2_CANSA|nr:hypothetical protein G4B88_000056 [Cannabis sativa]
MIRIEDYLTPQNLRCIKKLYNELGVDDIVDAMRKNPLGTSPFILRELEQEYEKLAKRRCDKNKDWANVYKKNYRKSLGRPLNRNWTPSYRFLPKNSFDDAITPTSLTDTERLCSEVLNDRYALVTSGKSDEYYFKHAEKNKYEKLMFKCEDEMFEFDMLVESVKVTIKNVAQLMEKINNNIDIAEMIRIEDYLTPQNLRCIKKLQRAWS